MTYVVDASVVVKWLLPEEGSELAMELMKQPLVAPELLIAECLNVLWRKVVRGELKSTAAEERARLLQAVGIVLEPMQPLAVEILALSIRLKHPAYDCAYLALARKLDGVLVTADRKLATRCAQPDAADLARHIRLLDQVGFEVREQRRSVYRVRGRRIAA